MIRADLERALQRNKDALEQLKAGTYALVSNQLQGSSGKEPTPNHQAVMLFQANVDLIEKVLQVIKI